MNKKIVSIAIVIILGILLYVGYRLLKPYRTFHTQEQCERVQNAACVEYDPQAWALPPKK